MTRLPVPWPYLAALAAALLLLRGLRRRARLFALLAWPGTAAHEACHLLVGWALGGRPVGFRLLPRRTPEGGWELGSASFGRLTWSNRFFIGLAPLLLLPGAYGLLRWRLAGHPGLDGPGLLVVYLAANLVYAALPSGQDLRIAARSPVGWLLLAGAGIWIWLRFRAG